MTTNWTIDAACSGMAQTCGYDLFYEEERELEAKAICLGCNVRLECLDDAINAHEYYGVRGGLNSKERELLDRRWRYWTKRTEEPKSLLDWTKEKVG